MSDPSESHADIWDLGRLQPIVVDPEDPGRLRRPRTGEPFLNGPVRHSWIATACGLPGAGPHVAIASLFLVHHERSRYRGGLGPLAGGLEIDQRSARRGLRLAEEAGILE